MRLTFDSTHAVCRRFVLLAPTNGDHSHFPVVEKNTVSYESLLSAAQRLRADVYREINAVNPSQLSPDGRHVQEADDRAYHLLSLDGDRQVVACARYVLHQNTAEYSDLMVSQSALAKSESWGQKLRAAVEAELTAAKARKLSYAEFGGWAIAPALRCTTEALRMMLSFYALSDLFGGVLGITTAKRACSAPILRRIGGQSVGTKGIELPAYYDPQYQCELEVIRFDSTRPNSKFQRVLDSVRAHMIDIPVIAPA